MFRWILKKVALCAVLLMTLYYLQSKNPEWLSNVGRLIGGEVGNRVSVAVSDILDRVGENTGLTDVVEVFREGT